MTTKEIAAAVGKDERTAQRWVKSVGDKMSSVGDKLSSSSPSKPADYTLPEVIEIIREGLGDAAAGVFEANAKERPVKATLPCGAQLSALTKMVDKGYLGRMQLQALLGVLPESTKVALPSPIEGALAKDELAAVFAIRGRKVAKARRTAASGDLFGGTV